MLLLSELKGWGEDYVEVTVDHRQPSIFANADGCIPAWLGIEYMAQAIAVFAGIRAKQNNQPIRLGFLLGSRKYNALCSHFEANSQLLVKVTRIYMDDDNLVLFDCTISDGENTLATADVKAIQPDNIDDILKSI